MSTQALVTVEEHQGRTRVIQRLGRDDAQPASGHATVRRTPPLYGLGILEYAAQREHNGELSPVFGARLEFGSLEAFVENAFANELGVPSAGWCRQSGRPCTALITDSELADVVFYIRYLAPPPRRVAARTVGAEFFEQIGCTRCHTPVIQTSERAPAPLRDISAFAYTDLSLHDLGQGPVRTAPLWGVNSVGPPYLHDASASSLSDAIEQHAGEAAHSRTQWRALSLGQREALVEYLRSL